MVVDLGSEPRSKQETFRVVANIFSEQSNNYIHHWDGGTFDNYDDAYEFWDWWEPPEQEMHEVMKELRKQGDRSHCELEIGIYNEDEEDLAFMNRTIDGIHELDYTTSYVTYNMIGKIVEVYHLDPELTAVVHTARGLAITDWRSLDVEVYLAPSNDKLHLRVFSYHPDNSMVDDMDYAEFIKLVTNLDWTPS